MNTDCERHGWYPTTQEPCQTCSAVDKVARLELQVERLRAALKAAPDAYRCEDCFGHLPKEGWDRAWKILAAAEDTEKQKCVCPNGTRTAIAHVSGCPAAGGP